MLQGLTPLTPADLTAELERGIPPALVNLLHQRSDGHCMRLADLDVELMMLLCARPTDDSFTRKAEKIRCRPRVTQHGGATKTAVT